MNKNLLIIAVAFAGVSCAAEKNNTPALANPADVKCLQDGYKLLQVRNKVGVPKYGVCYNPKNDYACESWAYFRKECFLVSR